MGKGQKRIQTMYTAHKQKYYWGGEDLDGRTVSIPGVVIWLQHEGGWEPRTNWYGIQQAEENHLKRGERSLLGHLAGHVEKRKMRGGGSGAYGQEGEAQGTDLQRPEPKGRGQWEGGLGKKTIHTLIRGHSVYDSGQDWGPERFKDFSWNS